RVLHYAHRETFGLSVNPGNGWSAQPDYFELFDDDDMRKQQRLYGEQQNAQGNPLIYNAMHIVIDPYGYTLLRASDVDIGGANDGGRLAAARCIKSYPKSDHIGNAAGSDVVVMRLADALLMKAEGIVRRATNGTTSDALAAANLVRARAFP